ncbi:CapA family protein [Streptomyces sp. OF8]|uniref:CapA family protein n=2 Tax=Streptomyces alkaliterrae TaxID=2213162 RepID=A0A5P0YRF6_9ACTN|nr:CapA family protein [Streptomyces alkaliterrae]MQS02855.1 CapA family protein [Streptomyces alkaliterrae]
MAATLALLLPATGCGALGDDAPEGDVTFTVAAAGDILIHPQLTEQAQADAAAAGQKGEDAIDFRPIMAGVKPVISKADLAICHLEPVLGKPAGPFESYPDFLVPPQIATAIKDVGYDTCSTASNHTLDHGPKGVHRTLDVLDEVGIKHTGSARSQKEADTPLIVDVKGVKVAQIAFSFGFNGREVPEDQPWLANKTSFKAIAAAERAARAAGAEVVILSIHWGRENRANPSGSQIQLARRIADKTGINLVIGHHSHVVQPMEKVNGTWVAYSLGNQIARHDIPTGLTEEGAIGWFEFTRRGGNWDVQARYVPTLVEVPGEEFDVPEHDPSYDLDAAENADDAAPAPGSSPEREHRLVDVAAALRSDGKLDDEQRARYRLAFQRTEGTMLNRGAARDGLKPLQGLP